MHTFSKLKNSVCAVALLAGFAVSPLMASDEFPEKTDNIKRMQVEIPGEDNILGYLPDELLFHILSYTAFENWGNLNLTCKRFHAISGDVFKEVQKFKQRFREIKTTLEEACTENPDHLLEHYTEALQALRAATPLLDGRTPEEIQALGASVRKLLEGKTAYKCLKKKGMEGYPSTALTTIDLPTLDAPALHTAAFKSWPYLAVSMVLLPEISLFDESDEDGDDDSDLIKMVTKLFEDRKRPAPTHPYLNENTIIGYGVEDHQLREAFVLIGDSQQLQRWFEDKGWAADTDSMARSIQRQLLFAGELMHRTPEARRDILAEAYQYIRKKDYDHALALSQPVVDQYPDVEAGAIANVAVLYEKKMERERGRQYQVKANFYAKKAVEIGSKKLNSKVYLRAARAYVEEEEWSKAIENFKTALEKNPGHEGGVYKEAGIAFIKGKLFAVNYYFRLATIKFAGFRMS